MVNFVKWVLENRNTDRSNAGKILDRNFESGCEEFDRRCVALLRLRSVEEPTNAHIAVQPSRAATSNHIEVKLSKDKIREYVLRRVASLTPRSKRCGAQFPLAADVFCIRRKGHRGRHMSLNGQLWSNELLLETEAEQFS